MLTPIKFLAIAVFGGTLFSAATFAGPAAGPASRPRPIDLTTPVATLRTADAAGDAGDRARLLACLRVKSPTERDYANAAIDRMIAHGKLNAAIERRFGPDVAKRLREAVGDDRDYDAMRTVQNADVATVSIATGDVALVRTGDAWQVLIEDELNRARAAGLTPQQLIEQSKATAEHRLGLLKLLDAGEITTAEELRRRLLTVRF